MAEAASGRRVSGAVGRGQAAAGYPWEFHSMLVRLYCTSVSVQAYATLPSEKPKGVPVRLIAK